MLRTSTLIQTFCVILAALLFSGCANGLFHYPDHKELLTPADAGQTFQDVYFTSADGTRLHGWFIPATGEAKGTVIHFHGNARNISAHYRLVAWLPPEGYNLFTFDYRGYGRSEDSPTREGIHQDALAAIDYVLSRSDVDPDRILVLGQSLGGAVAIAAVAEKDHPGIRGVVIESTFSSYRDIAEDKAREAFGSASIVIPTSLLVTDAYNPKDYIFRLSPTPLVLIYGTADRVVPFHHREALLAAAGEPKQLWVMKNGRHMDAFSRFLPQMRP